MRLPALRVHAVLSFSLTCGTRNTQAFPFSRPPFSPLATAPSSSSNVIRRERRLEDHPPRLALHQSLSPANEEEDLELSLSSVAVNCPSFLSRENAQQLVDVQLLPQTEYGDRTRYGRDAQGLSSSSSSSNNSSNKNGAILPNDPRLDFTYGEFPLSSLDTLLEIALPFVTAINDTKDPNYSISTNNNSKKKNRISMVDVGSGCGRLVLYTALSRPGWDIHGIEISSLLHNVAVQALDKGVEVTRDGGPNWSYSALDSSSSSTTREEEEEEFGPNSTTLGLYHGPASAFGTSVLCRADILFAYSTAFPAKHFSEKLGAMILGNDWSALLATSCRPGCVAITTDRALDPKYGWELVERLEVENKEVFGSTGYIHVLRK